MTGHDQPAVYTVEEAARILRVGRTAMYDSIRRGQVPSIRVGRSIRVPRHALEQLLNGNGLGVTPEAANNRNGRVSDVDPICP